MNVIVANKYSSMLQNLNIDVIKSLNGEFEVDDIISTFKNFFFQRMILDITALKNYKDISTLQKLSVSLDMSKVILVLDDSTELSSPQFLSQIISIGIYNFSKNIDEIMYLYNNPNSYRDVAHIHQLSPVAQAVTPNQPIVPQIIERQVVVEKEVHSETRIIGVKNVTKQAGATTLIYLMKKALQNNYSVVAIESGKSDFRFFNDKSLISATNTSIGGEITKNNDKDIILVDINDNKEAENMCKDIIYLVEPSIIKLNKLMLLNQNIFQKLKNKKVILNRSVLDNKDVNQFEIESGIMVFYNMPNVDDRADTSDAIKGLLSKMGLNV